MRSELSQEIMASPIMIVEDEEVSRLFLEKTLKDRGFTHLLCVKTAEEALQELPEFAPDLILLDIILPGMDGYDCCREIRRQKQYEDLPILVQTMLSKPDLRTRAFSAGATDFVSKPVFPAELCARVQVHLENRHAVKALRLYRNRVNQELESARLLQQTILPTPEDIDDVRRRCRLDIDAYYQPSSEIGGDFWGIKPLFPHQTAVWMVDFSGHGVASALNAFRLQAYLKEHSPLAARPGEYLSHLNDKMLQLLLRGQFATMFYGIIDTQSNRLFYACACAPHPVILRHSTDKAEVVDGTGNPLGIGMHLYPTQTIPFAPGDTLLLYSDTLTETPGNDGSYMTEEELTTLLSSHAGASATALKQILLGHFHKHAGEKLSDDLTLMICRRSLSL